jgi:hypothetical protein
LARISSWSILVLSDPHKFKCKKEVHSSWV